jgi:hypothetical protein
MVDEKESQRGRFLHLRDEGPIVLNKEAVEPVRRKDLSRFPMLSNAS